MSQFDSEFASWLKPPDADVHVFTINRKCRAACSDHDRNDWEAVMSGFLMVPQEKAFARSSLDSENVILC